MRILERSFYVEGIHPAIKINRLVLGESDAVPKDGRIAERRKGWR